MALFLHLHHFLPRLRIRRPNELHSRSDDVAIRLERSDAERLVDLKEPALEALDGRLRPVDLVRARAPHRSEPPHELHPRAVLLKDGATQRDHERLVRARAHARRCVLRLRAGRWRARDEVEGERLAREARLLVRLAHGRSGYVLAEVFAALWEQPLVAHGVAQEADA